VPCAAQTGEIWSWSPLELNRIAYADGEGDLWVACADGRSPRRIVRSDFTLPAWSDDGRVIAAAERKPDRSEISVIHLPADLRRRDAAGIGAELGEGFTLVETVADAHPMPTLAVQSFRYSRFVRDRQRAGTASRSRSAVKPSAESEQAQDEALTFFRFLTSGGATVSRMIRRPYSAFARNLLDYPPVGWPPAVSRISELARQAVSPTGRWDGLMGIHIPRDTRPAIRVPLDSATGQSYTPATPKITQVGRHPSTGVNA